MTIRTVAMPSAFDLEPLFSAPSVTARYEGAAIDAEIRKRFLISAIGSERGGESVSL